MIPVLYAATERTFNTNGLGPLSDALSCEVVEERNGEYELTMTYPITGNHYSDIKDRCIIMAIPSPYRTAQPFRIYEIETPINGIVTLHAHHVSYDLSGVPVAPFTAGNCSAALNGLVSNAVVPTPFTVGTDKSVNAVFTNAVPNSFRSLLGGQEGSILDVYGKGEYLFDKFSVYLYTNRGSDNGVTVAYGKNLTDFKMDRNLDEMVTGVYPYWSDMEGNTVVECSPKVIDITGGLDHLKLRDVNSDVLRSTDGDILTVASQWSKRIKILDLSSAFSDTPTADELYAEAVAYIAANDLTSPKVSISVSFVELAKTDEYKNIAVLEQCDLCDTVTVQFPKVGVNAKAEIIKITTDVLREKYKSMEIGDPKTTIADTIATIQLSSVTKDEMKTGLSQVGDVINNTSGTFEFIDNGDGTNGGFTIYEPGEVAFLRCTAGGIGLSQDGGVTYTNAITKYGVTATKLDVQNNGITTFETLTNSYGYPEVRLYDDAGDKLFSFGAIDVNSGEFELPSLTMFDPATGKQVVALSETWRTSDGVVGGSVNVQDPSVSNYCYLTATDAAAYLSIFAGSTHMGFYSNKDSTPMMWFGNYTFTAQTVTINGTSYVLLTGV